MRLKELKLELTQQCPLACVHCSTESHRKRTSALTRETVIRLIREGSGLGLEKVAFTGGEPLLVPYLHEAIRESWALGVRSSLYTCGAVDSDLNPLTADAAMALADAGLGKFIFSLYSHRAEVHNSVTGFQSLSTTIAAMQAALKTSVDVEIHFVAMRRNFRDLRDLVRAAATWGVGRLSVLRFVPHGRANNIAHKEDLTADEMRELRDGIINARAAFPRVNVRAGSPYNVLGIGYTPCDAAQEVLVVNHRGEIFPCDAFKNVEYYDPEFGSVLNQPLKDVWERSAFLNQTRTELAASPIQECGACEEFSGCKSGCLAQKILRDGWAGAHQRDPGCLVQITPVPAVRIEVAESALYVP
ncbi:MAG TPA: radical SAM protein [Terriglobales bacterium]